VCYVRNANRNYKGVKKMIVEEIDEQIITMENNKIEKRREKKEKNKNKEERIKKHIEDLEKIIT